MRQHYERLCRSARFLTFRSILLSIIIKNAIVELADALLEPDRDMWFRTTLFAIQGHWGEGTKSDLLSLLIIRASNFPTRST